MIYADFESILVPKYNGKQNPSESYMNKYQNHIACIYSFKKFSKPVKSNLGEDAV